MSLTKTVGLFAGTTLALAGSAFGTTEANTDAQIAELKQEIADLKKASGENWLTEQRATEIKGLVQDVLADADTRASLQGAGATAGFDNGFFIGSQDGNFLLRFNANSQLRWTLSRHDVDNADSRTETNWGFNVRHTGVMFSGHIVDPSWLYNLSFGFFDDSGDYDGESTTGTAFLQDAWIAKDFGNWWFKAGQFIAPYSQERGLGDLALQFVDRSNTNYVFGIGRTQGIEIGFKGDAWRAMFSFSDGLGPNSPQQNRGYSPNAFSPMNVVAFSGRAEFKLNGNWNQFDDQQSWRGEEFSAMIGVGGYWQHGRNNYTPGVDGDGDLYGATVDATIGWGGFGINAAAFYTGERDYVADTTETDQFAALIEAGFFVTEDIQIVGRFEWGDMDDRSVLTSGGSSASPFIPDDQSTLTLGLNWYFGKNRAKWQTDFSYAFDHMDSDGFGVHGNGWFDDADDEDGQWVFRTALTWGF